MNPDLSLSTVQRHKIAEAVRAVADYRVQNSRGWPLVRGQELDAQLRRFRFNLPARRAARVWLLRQPWAAGAPDGIHANPDAMNPHALEDRT